MTLGILFSVLEKNNSTNILHFTLSKVQSEQRNATSKTKGQTHGDFGITVFSGGQNFSHFVRSAGFAN